MRIVPAICQSICREALGYVKRRLTGHAVVIVTCSPQGDWHTAGTGLKDQSTEGLAKFLEGIARNLRAKATEEKEGEP